MSTATLESESAIRPQRYEPEDDGEFVVFRDVPVWKEHTNVEGHTFGPQELSRVIGRCNERIQDTGDFCPIVIGHTDDDDSVDPPLVGFAGPFRMGKVGAVRPKAAILTNFRFYREDLHRLKRYPRVSVEYWASEKDPFNGYFDPISLLGAKTPELDLGLRYSRHAEGQRLIRYSREAGVLQYAASAVCPGGSNTYVPSVVGDEKKPKPYAKEPTAMAISEEDLKQIVEAFKPVIRAEISEQVAAMKGEESETPEEVEDEVPVAAEAPERFEAAEEGMGDVADGTPAEQGSMKSQYAKVKTDRDQIKVKYEKLFRENAELQGKHQEATAKLAEVAKSEVRATRYSKLQEAEREGYTFDPSEEINDCVDMNDAQFEKHLTRIRTKYSKVPLGRQASGPRTGVVPREKPAKTADPLENMKPDERKRYSKAASKLYAERGGEAKGANFQDCLKEIVEKNGKPEAQVVG